MLLNDGNQLPRISGFLGKLGRWAWYLPTENCTPDIVGVIRTAAQTSNELPIGSDQTPSWFGAKDQLVDFSKKIEELASGPPSRRRRVCIAFSLCVLVLQSSCVGSNATSGGSSVPKSWESPTLRIGAVLGVVARVIDGDTIEVRLGERLLDVRLIGMDTPESVHPTVEDECFGAAATRYTRELLEGKSVELTFDVERRDLYGRTLAYVWTDNDLFNVEIVRAGYARSYTVPPNVRYAEAILRAQRSARREKNGLWNRCPDAVKATADRRPNHNRPCTRGYRPCLPPALDYDCFGGEGDGPKYAKKSVRVSGNDPYELDDNGNGRACGGQ